MPRDAFDSIIDAELNPQPRSAAPDPPPGSSSTTNYRDGSRRPSPVKLQPPPASGPANFFRVLGWVCLLLSIPIGLLHVGLGGDPGQAVLFVIVVAIGAAGYLAIAAALDALTATAHWSQQTAHLLKRLETRD